MHLEISPAQAIVSAGIVGFAFDAPRVFKSGIKAPVYLDNRRLLMHPRSWRVVIDALAETVSQLAITDPVIAGIETAGIPHSSALAFSMDLPTVFVRKQAKDHGLKQRIEGGDVRGLNVILVEDQITTGGSSLSGVEALRDAGANVEHCLAITSYGFREAAEAFAAAQVELHVLVTFAELIAAADLDNRLTISEREIIDRWLKDPHGWTL